MTKTESTEPQGRESSIFSPSEPPLRACQSKTKKRGWKHTKPDLIKIGKVICGK